MSIDDRLFSESEIAEIVRRAAELQESGSVEGYAPGLTRDELERVAKEVGIKSEFLEKAIRERTLTPQKRAKFFSFGEHIERVIPVEINPEDFDIITSSIRLMPSSSPHGIPTGGATMVGRSLQGQASGKWENPYFHISSRGGRTKIKVWTENAVAWAVSCIWFLPLIASFAIGKKVGVEAGVLTAVASAFGALGSFRYLVQKGRETTREIAERIEEAIRNAPEELGRIPTEARPELESQTTDVVNQNT